MTATIKHGHAMRGQCTRIYSVWRTMLARCTNPRNKKYASYGGRGITVCKRWRSFENFLKDMGEAPPGCTLDRKNNDKGYNKSNCRWATPTAQQRNRSNNRLLTCRGERRTMVEWCSLAKRGREVVAQRIRAGLSVEEALFGPLKKRASSPRVQLTYRGTAKPLRVWADELGVDYSTMRYRMVRGYTPEEVVHGK